MRVIELHSHVKMVQRGKGQSATAAAAYRSATRIHCERTGETHDYRRKRGVEHTTVLVSADAPAWALERETLWNAAELRERHPRAQPARDLELSFPAEFNAEQRHEAGLAIGRMLVERHGVAADLCWHKPGRKGDERNHHLHVLLTTRRFENGSWAKAKDRTLDDLYGKGKEEILRLRQGVAEVLNNIAARDRLEVYVEHLSFEKRGLDQEATQHMGSMATKMERQGIKTNIGNKNREITARNTERKRLREEYKAVAQAIAQMERHPKAQPPVLTQDDLNAFYRGEQERRRILLAALAERHGQQEAAARRALAQFIPASHENVIGQWRKLKGKTQAEEGEIARHRATLEAIEKDRRAALDAFERERLTRLDRLRNPEQQATPDKDERKERARLITEIYRSSDSAQALQVALAETGYTLAQGKRIVVIDREGTPYNLSKLVDGIREKDVRERLAGIALPDADETMQRLAGEHARQQAQEQSVKEEESVEPIQAELQQTEGKENKGTARQSFQSAAPPPAKPHAPVHYIHLAERQQLENERVQGEGEDARRRLNDILDQRYGPKEQRLRREIEPLEKRLKGAGALKVRILKLRGQLPDDAEERLEKLREEQALIEAKRRAAAELLEKVQRDTEAAIKQRQAQDREKWRQRAPQMAQDFEAASNLAQQQEGKPAPPSARASASITHTSLQRRQWDELFQFSDDAATERHRLIRSLELQYKMTDRDRETAAAYGHARLDEEFKAQVEGALERLEKNLKEREQALKVRHAQERESLQNGIAPPPTELAKNFERHAPEPMEIQAAPRHPEKQPQQPAPALKPIVHHPSPELRPPGMGRPARELSIAEPDNEDSFMEPQTSEETAAIHALLDQWKGAQERRIEQERTEQESATGGAGGEYGPDGAPYHELPDRQNQGLGRGPDRGAVLEP